jgi:DNA-binding MarR family transcriptional regulator
MHRTQSYDLLASALMDILGALNSPRQDDVLLAEAGVGLDRALFPLLVRIGAASVMNVAELAEQVGRDHSTVSRQMGKLEGLGLVRRVAGKADRRAREAVITEEGRRMVETITEARRRLLDRLLAEWREEEIQALGRLNRRLADAMRARQGETVKEIS